MNDIVTVKVLDGQSLIAPDGRVIGAGETVDVSAEEADFIVRMGAATIVAPDAAPDAAQP